MNEPKSPWRPVEELGTVERIGQTTRWTLNPGWEDMRLWRVDLSSGEHEIHLAYIDDDGDLCDRDGNAIGWPWYAASLYMEIPPSQ